MPLSLTHYNNHAILIVGPHIERTHKQIACLLSLVYSLLLLGKGPTQNFYCILTGTLSSGITFLSVSDGHLIQWNFSSTKGAILWRVKCLCFFKPNPFYGQVSQKLIFLPIFSTGWHWRSVAFMKQAMTLPPHAPIWPLFACKLRTLHWCEEE